MAGFSDIFNNIGIIAHQGTPYGEFLANQALNDQKLQYQQQMAEQRLNKPRIAYDQRGNPFGVVTNPDGSLSRIPINGSTFGNIGVQSGVYSPDAQEPMQGGFDAPPSDAPMAEGMAAVTQGRPQINNPSVQRSMGNAPMQNNSAPVTFKTPDAATIEQKLAMIDQAQANILAKAQGGKILPEEQKQYEELAREKQRFQGIYDKKAEKNDELLMKQNEPLSGKEAVDNFENGQSAIRAFTGLLGIQSDLINNPENAGALGSVRTAVKETKDMIGDVAGLFPFIGNTIKGVSDKAGNAMLGSAPVRQNDVVLDNLAGDYARAKSGRAATNDQLNQAKKILSPTGWKSGNAAFEMLGDNLNEMAKSLAQAEKKSISLNDGKTLELVSKAKDQIAPLIAEQEAIAQKSGNKIALTKLQEVKKTLGLIPQEGDEPAATVGEMPAELPQAQPARKIRVYNQQTGTFE